jgi:tRNA G18 (ribose-2'-O)-methylase SpoU
LKKLTTESILSRNLSRSTPFHSAPVNLILHNIRSKHNVGSAFRSADAFGVNKIILSGYTPTPPDAEISKTAIGAEEFVKWEYYKTVDEILENYPTQQFHYVGIEQMEQSIELQHYQKPKQAMNIVFGNEVRGIDEAFIVKIHDFVEIPQYGHKHSLNISVALGVVLYAFVAKSLA